MSKIDFFEIKSRKPFEKTDIFIYIIMTALIVSLFCAFIFFSAPNNVEGFKISYKSEVVFTLKYSTREYSIKKGFENNLKVDLDENAVTFYSRENNSGYNVISFNANEKSVWISKANCSVSADCVHSPKVTNSGSVICAPRELKVLPLSGGFVPPTTG